MNKQSNRQSEGEYKVLRTKLWQVIVAVSVIIGLPAALYALLPKLIVVPTTQFESSNPLSTLFSVTNDGLMSIHSVKIDCAIDEISLEGFTFQQSELSHGINRAKLEPGENAITDCLLVESGRRIKSAKISLIVSFRPSFFPFSQTRQYPFSGEMSKDGRLHWFPRDI